jgi:hypothetical protein
MAREDLTGETIRLAFADDPSGKQFEQFVRRLLEAERQRRFAPDTVKIDGPDKTGKADGGKDCVVTVRASPRTPRGDHDLIGDELVSTRYSAKNGREWATSVHRDVGYAGHLTGRNEDEPKSPPTGLLEHIAAGGRYVFVISSESSDREPVLKQVRKALDHHMRLAGLTPSPNWGDNIEFVDANTLASIVRCHKPGMPQDLERKLGIDWPRELDRFDEWTARFARELPDYVPDPQRQHFLDLIVNPGEARVIRVFGPPGVGKSRLVHRALQRLDEFASKTDPNALSRPTDSVFMAANPEAAETVISSTWTRSAGAAILVADEVTSVDADGLARAFLARADARARLFLIGVSDEDVYEGRDRQGVHGISLGELAPDSTRTLIEGQISGDRPGLVDRVLALSEGYPLFAILLAEALDKDDDALAEGNDDAARWDAAKRVLAGSRREYGNDVQTWRDEVTRRALCLLVVIIAGDRNLGWDELWNELGDDLRRIISDTYEWERVKNANGDCIGRGLLRTVGSSHRRYVSPANLVRMILNHFFGEGPNDLGPRLARCDARLQDRVHAMAKRFEASRSVQKRLSRGLLAELQRRRAAHEPLVDLIQTRALELAAANLPEETAALASGLILDHNLTALAGQTTLRHGMRALFEALVQLPVSRDKFAQLEAALFAMAQVEDEPWANNATGIWRSLFLVSLSQTHQPWFNRFALLTRRCREGPANARVLAISGLARAAAASERGLGHAPGREWPRPSYAEYLGHKRDAWRLLLELGSMTEAAVAAAARRTIADELRGCLMAIVDAAFVREIAKQVARWDVAQRLHLAETLADIRRYDEDDLDTVMRETIDELQLRLRPSDFVERLVAQVGSWHPGPWAIDADGRAELEATADETLGAELLDHPHERASQWPWLASAAALRRRQFMRVIGRLDRSRRVLPELETLPSSTSDALLPWYVEGWASVAEDEVDEWLAHELAGGGFERTAVFVLPFLAPSDRRLTWLAERVEQAAANVATLSALYPRWVHETSAPILLRLINACVEHDEYVLIGVELVGELLRRDLDGGTFEQALDIGARLLVLGAARNLSGSHERDWKRLLTALLRYGRIEASLDAIVRLMASKENLGSTPHIRRCLNLLFEQGLAEQLWQRAQVDLEGDGAAWILWELGHAGVLSSLSADSILAWVGEQESRARDVVSLINPYDEVLPELARQLLARFGSEGPVAGALHARVYSTPRAVSSLLEFKRQQLANAQHWADDELPAVRRWAELLIADLRESIAEAEAHELFRRKLG